MTIDQPHERFITKLLQKYPRAAFQYVAATLGLDQNLLDQAHEIFNSAKHIEIHPLADKEHPGMIIILDQKLSLWFYKYGTEYRYDGFELGDYNPELDALGVQR